MATNKNNQIIYHPRFASVVLRHYSALASVTKTGRIRSVAENTAIPNAAALHSSGGDLSRLAHRDLKSTGNPNARRRACGSGFWAFVFIVSGFVAACDDAERNMTRGVGGDSRSETTPAASKEQSAKVEAVVDRQVYSDDHFVESDLNRDPFRSFTALFKSAAVETPQRTVIMSTTAIENMRLIAIISGVPSPKAMLVDGIGVGHIVERGMYLGRPEIVRASENVSMTLNWRVHRIRENEVVLTRADPTDPNRPPLTRVIPLREDELLATR